MALCIFGHPFPQTAQRRDAHAAGHDGRMAGDAVPVGNKTQNHAAVQAEQVTGIEQVRCQDAGFLQLQRTAGSSVQNIHHPAAGVTHVHAALPDVIVVNVADPPGKDAFRTLHRSGTACPRGDVVPDLVGEGFVLQQRHLEQENIGILGVLGPFAQQGQLILGQHDGGIVQGPFMVGVADNAVQPDEAAVNAHHRADGQPAGCGSTCESTHRLHTPFLHTNGERHRR